MSTLLLIPLHGDFILEKYDEVDLTDRARGILEVRASDLDVEHKPYVQLRIEIDDEPGGSVGFLAMQPIPTALMNRRARTALAFLTGVHMVIPGDCVFLDLPAEMVDAITQSLSQ